MIVNWDAPIFNTNCPTAVLTQTTGLEVGSNFPQGNTLVTYEATGCEGTASCIFMINVSIETLNQGCGEFLGYTKLGIYEGYGYYQSNVSSTWSKATETTQHMLLSIQNKAENDYVQSITKESVFIGLNDKDNEGALVWQDQTLVAYTNLAPYDWAGANTEENDYGTFLPWDGKWSFSNQWVYRPHLIKKECINTTVEPVNDCPLALDGYTYWGKFNDHAYFLSDNKMTWAMAYSEAITSGGYLASINSYDENQYLLNLNTEMIFIGYHDDLEEGSGQWASEEEITVDYSFNNNESGDFAVMNFWNGEWEMVNQYVQKKFVIEIECNEDNESTETSDEGIVLIGINPNPTFDNIVLDLTTPKDELIKTIIYNANGQRLEATKHPIQIGSNKIEFDLVDLEPGVYFLRITSQLTDQTLRFVKLRW